MCLQTVVMCFMARIMRGNLAWRLRRSVEELAQLKEHLDALKQDPAACHLPLALSDVALLRFCYQNSPALLHGHRLSGAVPFRLSAEGAVAM